MAADYFEQSKAAMKMRKEKTMDELELLLKQNEMYRQVVALYYEKVKEVEQLKKRIFEFEHSIKNN
jgi:hypothetical protein